MTTGASPSLLRQLRTLFVGGSTVGLGEGQLLDRFIARRDEAAFEALVARHGPMVLGVCRRTLHDERDAEDAFQATFLVLVKKAGQIRDREGLGPWLYGVARRVALRARSDAARRDRRERPGPEVEEAVEPPLDPDRREFRAVIDEELDRLPESYRAPVILCYLEGLTHEEAAARLRWPVGTVRSRMARAREKLRGRLACRGLSLPAAVMATALAPETLAAPLPPALLALTLKAALGLATDGTKSAVISATVASLTEGVIKTMSLPSAKTLVATLIVAAGLAGGAVVTGQQFGGAAAAPAKAEDTTPKTAQKTIEGTSRDRELRNQLSANKREMDEIEAKLSTARKRREDLIQQINLERTRVRTEAQADTPPVDPTSPPNPPDMIKPAVPRAVGPGAMASGMTGMMGGGAMRKAGGPQQSQVLASGEMVTIVTPDGGRVAVYTEGKPMSLYRVPKGVNATPIATGDVVALHLQGPKISEVAAYSKDQSRWSVQRLAQPVMGPITPVLSGNNFAVTRAGRYLCAFSGASGKWAIADLGEAYQKDAAAVQGYGGMAGMMGSENQFTKRGTDTRSGMMNNMAMSGGMMGSMMMGGMGGGPDPDGVHGPIVGNSTAVCRAGRRAYAYSIATDRWDVVDLGEDSGSPPILAGKFITVASNKGLYIYNEKVGKWEGVDLGKDESEK